MAGDKGKTEKSVGGNDAASDSAIAFDIHDPKLPGAIKDAALTSGGFPYQKRMNRKLYEKRLLELQHELVKLQTDAQKTGKRIVALYEGRDSAGKGGCISRTLQYLNPRHARSVALTKPTETERGEWYFQRYSNHLPTKGDIVLFDRSWYNRAGVERVMGFCTEDQLANFLREVPDYEALLVRDGIYFFKFFLTIGREMQLKRFHDRRHNPLKHWKLSPIDMQAISKWDAYTEARDEMFRFTHTATSPWTVIHANDKRRARLESIKCILRAVDYAGKDPALIGEADEKIVSNGPRQDE